MPIFRPSFFVLYVGDVLPSSSYFDQQHVSTNSPMLLAQREKLPSDDVTDVPMKDICYVGTLLTPSQQMYRSTYCCRSQLGING